jgi:hypothetical protein
MRPFAFFDHRVRGFRIVELGGLAVLLILVLTVYLAKTGAGGKRADIDHLQGQIGEERTQIRILKAEVATLEQPERLEALSARYLGLVPISARREVTPQALADVAHVTPGDHKSLPVLDPLTATGSPDLTAAVAPTSAPAGTPAPASPAATVPAPTPPAVVAEAAPASHVAAKPAPIKLARAEPKAHVPPKAAKSEASIDAILTDEGAR